MEYVIVGLLGVVIVLLLVLVLRKNNNKLATNYIETIAGQWKRAGLKMQLKPWTCWKENKNILKVDNEKVTKEPVWFNKVNEASKVTEADKEELENLLKEFK